MEVIIRGDEKEIAALLQPAQERQPVTAILTIDGKELVNSHLGNPS